MPYSQPSLSSSSVRAKGRSSALDANGCAENLFVSNDDLELLCYQVEE